MVEKKRKNGSTLSLSDLRGQTTHMRSDAKKGVKNVIVILFKNVFY